MKISRRKSKRKSYSSQALENGIQAVLSGHMNVNQASNYYQIPYETLRSKTKKNSSDLIPNQYHFLKM